MLPNFLVIGAMKAGTDSVYEYLRAHPDVFMASPKELHYFVGKREHWGREWYESKFADANGYTAIGEACPTYSRHPTWPGAPERIHGLIPDVKLIYLVRHPVERMGSHYLHDLIGSRERRPMHEALLEDPNYLYPSLYAMQIERFLEVFAREQLLVVSSEQLRFERRQTMKEIYTFIGVAADWHTEIFDREFHRIEEKRATRPIAIRVQNAPGYAVVSNLAPEWSKKRYRRWIMKGLRRGQEQMSDDLREKLRALVRDDAGRLRRYVPPDFPTWDLDVTTARPGRST